MTKFKGAPLALPLSWEEHELSEGYSSIVYDGRGMAIDKHLSAAQAEAIVRRVNAHGELLALSKLLAESLRYEIKRNERSGDDEGARLKGFTLSRVEAAIAAAEGRETADAPKGEPAAAVKPRFVIVISEGGVTDVVSDDPAIVGMPFATIDHDTEGLGPDDEVLLIPQAEGEPREAYMREHEVTKAEFPIGPASIYEPAPAPEGWEG